MKDAVMLFLELPGARVVIGRIKIWQILFYYGCVVVICVIYYYKKKHPQKKSMRKGRNAMKHRNVKNKENVEIY